MATLTRILTKQVWNLHLICGNHVIRTLFQVRPVFIVTAEQRCLHTSIVANTAMSKFDQKSPMPYEKLVKNLEVVKSRLNRPMTPSEKILYSHSGNPLN